MHAYKATTLCKANVNVSTNIKRSYLNGYYSRFLRSVRKSKGNVFIFEVVVRWWALSEKNQ